jgi:uncharacterized protein YndB with AHSA1/START domain
MKKAEPTYFRVRIKGRIEDVWNEITKTDSVQKCFFNSRMHVQRFEPGATIQMRTPNGRYVGVVGEILEFDPPRRFSHTFKFTNLDDPPCRVTYELKEAGDFVEFTMILEDVPAGTKTEKQMTQGGTMIVNTLKAVVETGRPGLGTRLLYLLFAVMQPFTPSRCKTANWPL